MQLLLYAPITSSRLQYICHFIFKEIMLIDFSITINSEEFQEYTGAKIAYTNDAMPGDHLKIGSGELLFENNIREQVIECFEVNNYKAFFKTENADLPFDIFAAAFYLLSRYEEYLPHEKDMYGRYAHENSLAFKEHFLHLPLINTWVNHFAEILKSKFPNFTFHRSPFNFVPTYDIDIAYSYKYKSLARNIKRFFKAPSLNFFTVLTGISKDPFDAYDWMNNLHNTYNLKPLYFFLVAEKNSSYDKNILPHKNAIWKLIKQHAKKYAIGIHPSWQSGDVPGLIKKEIIQLQAMSEINITRSRQHYIRFNLPATYRLLGEAGIADDYSMGYGSINGFRASVANSFFWYDLQKNEPTNLRIHPFCFMEANSFYEQKYTPAQAHDELMHYYTVCKKNGSQMITIWHNNFLGTDKVFAGWREMYAAFINEINKNSVNKL